MRLKVVKIRICNGERSAIQCIVHNPLHSSAVCALTPLAACACVLRFARQVSRVGYRSPCPTLCAGPITQCQTDYLAYVATPVAGAFNTMKADCQAAAGNPALGALSTGASAYAGSPAGSAGTKAASAEASLVSLPSQAVRSCPPALHTLHMCTQKCSILTLAPRVAFHSEGCVSNLHVCTMILALC